MSVEAAADALVPEKAPEPVQVEVIDAPVQSEEDILSAKFDELTKEPDEAPENPVDEPAAEVQPVEEPAVETEEQTTNSVEPLGNLPKGLRDNWDAIPDAAREAFNAQHKETTDKLAEQGRLMQGISPIRDALVEMVQKVPEMASLRPEQVAAEIQSFRENVLQPLSTDPVNTLLKVAKERGVEGQLKAALSGEQATTADQHVTQLTQQVQNLQRQLQQVADPQYLQQHVEHFTTQSDATRVVNEFAQKAEHWEAVENTMPAAIQYVQGANPSMSQADILSAAYDLETQRLGLAKPKTVDDTPKVDPKQTEKAKLAKSVNVSNANSGKSKPVTEEEAMGAVWDRLNS